MKTPNLNYLVGTVLTLVSIFLVIIIFYLSYFYIQAPQSEISSTFESYGFVVKDINISLSYAGVKHNKGVEVTLEKQLWKSGPPTEIQTNVSLERMHLFDKFEMKIYGPNPIEPFYNFEHVSDVDSDDEIIIYHCGKQICFQSRNDGITFSNHLFEIPEDLSSEERWEYVSQEFLRLRSDN